MNSCRQLSSEADPEVRAFRGNYLTPFIRYHGDDAASTVFRSPRRSETA